MKLLAIVSPLNKEGMLAMTRPATHSAVAIPTKDSRSHSAVSADPSNMNSASRIRGVARSVERSAKPAVVSVMNDLSQLPMRVGFE